MRFFNKYLRIYTLFILFILTSFLHAFQGFQPNELPAIEIPFTEKQIILDGELTETFWSDAARADNFCEFTPGDRTRPKVKTEAYIIYNQTTLYVAFKCYDDPVSVRASLVERDNIWQDDYAGVLIDTYGNSNWAYYLFSNPIGVQGDSRFSTTAGEDDGFDIIYYSEGKITDFGYQLEMAIPFSSLRFSDDVLQKWRINFWRNHPRESRFRYSWASISKDDPCFLCQFGKVENIRDIKPGSSLEILPYLITSQSGQQSNEQETAPFKNGAVKGTAGGNVKWNVTPGITLEATINPDFSQIESDADQVDVNRTFALYFPERRPFFQEGSDLFNTWVNIVYTRSINNPLISTKLIGRWDNSTLAYIAAYDENTPLIIPFEEYSRVIRDAGKSFSNIVRFKQQFGNNNYIGLLMSDRRINDGGILNYGIDGLIRFMENYQFEFQFTGALTNEPNDTLISSGVNNLVFDNNKTSDFDGENFSGDAIYFSVERDAKHWDWDLDFRETSPRFRTGNGFIGQNSKRQAEFWSAYTFYFENNPWFDRIQPLLRTGRVWNYDGLIKDEWIYPAIYMSMKGQLQTEIGFFWDNENYSDKQFNHINRFSMDIISDFSEMFSFGLSLMAGKFIDRKNLVRGHGLQEFELYATIKPLTNFFIEPSYTYAELIRDDTNKYAFSGAIFRLRFNYQFTRRLSSRIIVQHNNFVNQLSVEPLVSYKINPFTIFYAGITEDKQNYSDKPFTEVYNWTTVSRQYFLKFQYLFSL
ncbi:MAG: carbohydrate binding family 9 domain-containing protein [Calditrichaeota bacterium]|nr:carbohydrate binding family 9 domain-containing protein [Calditrichota bacterium]